jgi:two-component system, oxyanion-binding sensor
MDGTIREGNRYLLLAKEDTSSPDPLQAAWLYAQMVRWRQTKMSPEALKAAQNVFRPDLYEAAFGRSHKPQMVSQAIGAFAGPVFDPENLEAYFAALRAGPGTP